MTGHLFPFLDYWWFYAAFTGLVVAFLVLDLGVFHRKAHVIGFREAAAWTAVSAGLALLFCAGLYKYAVWNFGANTGKQVAAELLTGYVVEWSLSLDNMFVFVLVFRYFGTPAQLQHRILFYGILGALIFRGVFVFLGAELLQYGWVVILFGVFLIITGIRMMFSAERQVEPEQSLIVRGVRRLLPVATDSELATFLLATEWKIERYADSTSARVHRSDRYSFRRRFRSCDLCDHPRAVSRLHIERVCDSRPSRDVFSSRRRPCEIPPVALWLGAHSDFRGAENVLAQRGLAGAFPKHNIPRCHRWSPGSIHRSVARFSHFPRAERSAN